MEPTLEPEAQIVAALRRIMRAVDLHSRHLADEFGLTGPQLSVMKAILQLAPATPSSVARSVHLSPATVTGILTRLERRGLLRRTPGDDDRRTRRVELTPEGERVMTDAPSLLQDRFRNELQRLEDWERTQVLSVLQRIASMMDAEELDASPHLVSDGRALGKQPAQKTPSDLVPLAEE